MPHSVDNMFIEIDFQVQRLYSRMDCSLTHDIGYVNVFNKEFLTYNDIVHNTWFSAIFNSIVAILSRDDLMKIQSIIIFLLIAEIKNI